MLPLWRKRVKVQGPFETFSVLLLWRGRYFDKESHHTSIKFQLGVIRWVHKLFKWALLLHHPKKGSFKATITQTLTTVRGMKIMPLLCYNHHNLALQSLLSSA
jgi:hypothetical protein